jgi:hypothetical protein
MSEKKSILRISTLSLVSLGLFCLFILDCHPAPQLRFPAEELEPEKVLESAIANQNQMKTLASLISFNLKSSKGSFSGDLELFFIRPDSLAFRVKAFLGPDYITGVIIGDDFLFYFPRLQRYYEGINLSCSEEEIYQSEINLFCLLKILTLETQLRKVGTIYRGTDKKNFIFEQRGEIWEKSYWIDKEEAYLRKCMWEETEYSSPEEAKGFVIEYKDFREINGIRTPQEIKIKSLNEKEKLRLKFLETKINSPISKKKFQIKIPEEAKPLEMD